MPTGESVFTVLLTFDEFSYLFGSRSNCGQYKRKRTLQYPPMKVWLKHLPSLLSPAWLHQLAMIKLWNYGSRGCTIVSFLWNVCGNMWQNIVVKYQGLGLCSYVKCQRFLPCECQGFYGCLVPLQFRRDCHDTETVLLKPCECQGLYGSLDHIAGHGW